MQTCPQCQKELPDNVNKCKYCDYHFFADPKLATPTLTPVISTVPTQKKSGIRLPIFFLVLVVITWSFLSWINKGAHDQPTESKWLPISGNIYSGAKVYMGSGENKTLAFTVLGGNENCSFGRGLYVEFPSDSKEWKDRSALISGDSLFIKTDDPALEEMSWRIYPCP